MALVPTGTIEDHHGMGVSSDLAADLAEVMVHRCGIADRHDQRRRLAPRRAHRTKQIGRAEAAIFWRHRPAAGWPPYTGPALSAIQELQNVGLRSRIVLRGARARLQPAQLYPMQQPVGARQAAIKL